MLRWSVLMALQLCGGLIHSNGASASREVNMALWGVATQSSTLDGVAVASKAIDENLQGYCSQTKYQLAPWWRVDLQATYPVTSVAITNGGDAVSDGMSGAEIRIGDSLEMNGILNARCATVGTLGAGETRSFDCGGIAGRYITVLVPSVYQYLTLCEVQVFAPPDPVVNVALGGVAIQSSTLNHLAIASKAIDGNLRSYLNQGYCSHTSRESGPWWRVDLLATYRVTSVAVTNRGDDFVDRINGTEIHIGDSLENNGILNTRCVTIESIPAGETRSFDCGRMAGRYVVAVTTGSEYLTMCEVQVFALPPDDQRLALKITITATSLAANLLETPETRERVFEQIRLRIGQHLYNRAINVMRWREDGHQKLRGRTSIKPTPGIPNCTAT